MSNSAPTTPRKESNVVTTQTFFSCFKQCLAISTPTVMHSALLKITKLEAENRILRGELKQLHRDQKKASIDLDDKLTRFEDLLDILKVLSKSTRSTVDLNNQIVEGKFDFLYKDVDKIKETNSELKSAHKILESGVLQLQGIAKWKIDLERFENVKFELNNFVQRLETFRTEVQSMKKQKYKIQSKVSQLENTITRQAESMHLDLRNIKKQKKKATEGKRRTFFN